MDSSSVELSRHPIKNKKLMWGVFITYSMKRKKKKMGVKNEGRE